MTKADLIAKMAEDAGLSKAATATVMDSLIDNVTKALKKKDGKVTLVGFGTFTKAKRKARKGRNPQTGEAIKIKARNVVKFKPGKKLKRAVLMGAPGAIRGRRIALPRFSPARCPDGRRQRESAHAPSRAAWKIFLPALPPFDPPPRPG